MPNRSSVRWSVVLGVALGGFFDGILLHQILQWHHLLSLVPGMTDVRAQVLWDGYFHALMYVIAVIALWGLWRSRNEAGSDWGSSLIGAALIGFGIWHVLDSVLSHWILGIHRIKLDSPHPLAWDLLWLATFGIVPGIVGKVLLRKSPPSTRKLHGSTVAVFTVGLLTAGAAGWSLKAPPDQRFTTVVFPPSVSPAKVINAIVAADGRLAWADPNMGVVVIDVPTANRLSFYRRGALLVSGSGLPSGCFAWSRHNS
ncbi:MAG: DUF2243 domain-containing protein [Sphingobium sp.]